MRTKLPVFLCLLFLSSSAVLGQTVIRKCIICHQKPDLKMLLPSGIEKSVTVNRKALSESVHGNLKCQDCHADVTVIPHRNIAISKVNCERCHFNGNNLGVPDSPLYDQFHQSIHGQKLAELDPKAPDCQSCHGGHHILKAENPASLVHKSLIPRTCGTCHQKELIDFSGSIHGVALLEKSILNVPVCTDCHGRHNVYSSDMSVSRTNVQNVPDTCKACHEDFSLMNEFQLDTEQADTYSTSFHGVALKFGEVAVANCASCHGTHTIRTHDDPQSSIYPDNIPETCGKCHKGANENFARGRIHLDPSKKESGLVYYVSNFFIWLTSLTMIALFIHIFLDLRRRLKERKEQLAQKGSDA